MCTLISSAVGISSTWKAENQRSLEETLSVSVLNDTNDAECDLEKIVNYETCVHLLANDNVSCELKFKSTQNNMHIARIAVVTEARILELFGNCEEYLATTHADFIDEFEDMSVYMAVLSLPESSPECSIKLVRPKNQEQMWIYGINVVLEKVKTKVNSSVNFENVNKILKESGHQLTEKAEKCKKFLQMYSSVIDPSKMPNRPPDPQVLMKMFESAYLPRDHPFKEQAKTMSQCLTDLLPGLSTTTTIKDTGAESTTDLVASKIPGATMSSGATQNDLQLHIERCFNALENRLDEKLNAIETRLNVKLDKILLQLEKIQTSM